tara:strand:+ start:110 stop:466 length:357 start_codon:yes stop_codon:yes gene_type:complete
MEEILIRLYPNYPILKQMIQDTNISGEHIENIMSNNSDYEWLEGVKKWYSMNLNRCLTKEQTFNTIFLCLEDLKKGEETFSKQPLNKGSRDNLYKPSNKAAFILTRMLITPQYRYVSR